MESNNSKEQQQQDQKKTERFLWELLMFVVGSYVLKTSWNQGFVGMFQSLPRMYFGNSVGIISFLYIVSRTVSAGLMGEVRKSVSIAVEALETITNKFSTLFKVNFKPREKEYESTSDTDNDLN
jgi:formate/nitrite transporter FocA (FNT family)